MDVSSETPIEEIQEKPQINQSPIVRVPVKHANLGIRSHAMDMSTMVELTSFSTMGKIQPFSVTISTTAALVVDLHCHLMDKEVCGYLGGHWDINSHTLSITNAFPCRYAGKDKTLASMVEAEIAKAMEWQRVILVGWYHSHRLHAAPSLRDVDYQLDYQIKMKGPSDNGYTPCVGLICSPYHADANCYESNFNVFWSMPPPENRPHEYPRPMLLTYTITQEPFISQESLDEIKKCIDYYRSEGGIDFKKNYNNTTTTYLERLKNSLASKLPGRQRVNGTGYWDVIREMILPGSKDESSSSSSSSSSYTQMSLSESLAQTPGISSNNVFLAPINFKPDTTITSSITKHYNNQQATISLRDKNDHDGSSSNLPPTFKSGELTVSLKNNNNNNNNNNNKIDSSKMNAPLTAEALDKLGATLSQFPIDLPQHLSQFSDINKLSHFSPSDIVKFPGFSFDELSKASTNVYARNIANLLGPFAKNVSSHIPTTSTSTTKDIMSDRKNDYTPSDLTTSSSSSSSIEERLKKIDHSVEQISKPNRPTTDFTTAEELSISSVRPDFGAMLDMSNRSCNNQQQLTIKSTVGGGGGDQGESLNLTKDRQ